MEKPKRYRETLDYLKTVHRMVVAAGKRVSQGDPAELARLCLIKDDVDYAINLSIDGLRASGATWDDIGLATGTTRQAAHQKWGPNGTGGKHA